MNYIIKYAVAFGLGMGASALPLFVYYETLLQEKNVIIATNYLVNNANLNTNRMAHLRENLSLGAKINSEITRKVFEAHLSWIDCTEKALIIESSAINEVKRLTNENIEPLCPNTTIKK